MQFAGGRCRPRHAIAVRPERAAPEELSQEGREIYRRSWRPAAGKLRRREMFACETAQAAHFTACARVRFARCLKLLPGLQLR
jgi:hypothetical protein